MERVSDLLGIDRQAAAEVPLRIARAAFFDQLAKHGISPSDDQQAVALLEASDKLESKRAAFQAANDPVNKGLQMLIGKKEAASPQPQARDLQTIRHEAYRKVAELLADPYVYGAQLVNLVESE